MHPVVCIISYGYDRQHNNIFMLWKYSCMNNAKESRKTILIYLSGDTGRTEKDNRCKK
jgi:hypothetical protein